jgi:hypothetical protein
MRANYSTPFQFDQLRCRYDTARQTLQLGQLDHQSSAVLYAQEKSDVWWPAISVHMIDEDILQPYIDRSLFFSKIIRWIVRDRMRITWSENELGAWAWENLTRDLVIAIICIYPEEDWLEPGLLIREQASGKQMIACWLNLLSIN